MKFEENFCSISITVYLVCGRIIMFFRELQSSNAPSIREILNRNHNNEELDMYCILSPSGRYGLYIMRTEVPDFRPHETHFYNYHFIVSDFILDTRCDYISMCSPFKRFHRFYFLNDSVGVLVDFSRNNGTVTQNLIIFSHINYTVTCEYARIWNFNVDDMLYETDNTNGIGTTDLIKYGNIDFLPLLGERDYISKIFCRIVPANPFYKNDKFRAPMVALNEEDAYQRAVQTSNSDPIELSDLCTDKRCYPLIHGTSLYFIAQFCPRGFMVYTYTCVAILRIDFINYFNANFKTTAPLQSSISPLLWYIPEGKYYLRPRFIKIIAQSGPIVALRACISAPRQNWIVLNLNTMIITPLELIEIINHDCVMIDRNRLVFQQHENLNISNYGVMWVYFSVPKLKYLAFWKAVITFKQLRTKKCWQKHLKPNDSCNICDTFKIIEQLSPCCCNP